MMKYAIFSLMLVGGVPLMAMAAASSRLARGALLGALVFTPLLGVRASINFMSVENYRGPDRGFELTLTDLIVLALIAVLVLKFSSRLVWLPHNALWMFLLWILSAISLGGAQAPLFSTFTLFKMMRMFAVYWCIVNVLRVDGDLRPVMFALVAIGIVIALIALKQKYVDHIYRVHGPFDHSNTIPLYLNLIMPTTLMAALLPGRLPRPMQWLGVAAALGMVLAIVVTFSRAGQALAGCSLLAVLALANLRAQSFQTLAAAAVVGCAALVGGAMAADSILERIRSAPASSAEARDEFNIAAELMAGDRPLGVGINNFSVALTETPHYRAHIEVMGEEKQAGVAHHIYWLTAAEIGYPGLFVFLIIIARFITLGIRHAWPLRNSYQLLLAGAVLGMVTLHASGFLEWGLRITPVTYQFMICAALTVHLAGETKHVARRRLGRSEMRCAA